MYNGADKGGEKGDKWRRFLMRDTLCFALYDYGFWMRSVWWGNIRIPCKTQPTYSAPAKQKISLVLQKFIVYNRTKIY